MRKIIIGIVILVATSATAQQPVKIDQTTPGTTNAVAATNLPTTVDTNSGSKSASTLRVVLATDQPALTNKLLVTPDSVALPANQSVNVNQVGGTAVFADPCQSQTKQYFSKSGTASVVLVTGTSAKKTILCSLVIVVGAAQNLNIVEGTGSTCGTGTAAYPGGPGGTTAAAGWNFAANDGLAYGNGAGSLAQAATNADDVCALVANAVQTNISGSYVQQ